MFWITKEVSTQFDQILYICEDNAALEDALSEIPHGIYRVWDLNHGTFRNVGKLVDGRTIVGREQE